jgi:PAS domain S-box-containing protein
MVSKPRLCDIFEAALPSWIEMSGAWRSSFRERDVARILRCEGCVVQDQATHASKDDGKSEGGSQPLAPIRTTWRCLNRWYSGIGLRLLARGLLFSSAITLLLTLLQLYFDYRRDVGTIDRQITEIEGSYRRSLGEGLWNLDARQLELQVDGILHLPDIRFVEVREATDRADPTVVTAGTHQANADVHREFPIFYMNRGAGQTLGVLSIEATFGDVYRRLFDTAIVILISQGAKTFAVSFFILYIVNRLITRHLVKAAKFVGGYDLRRSPPPLRLERRPLQQVDELDQLVAAFNGMCASLQTAYGELRESEQRFRDYTEMASDWLWATDRKHRFTFFSEQVDAFGYDGGKWIGKHRWEVAADFGSNPEKWREHIAILERREPFRDFVYENRRTDGSPGTISVSGKPAFDAEGRFSGYRGVASDLTDRKRAEQALQRSESYLAEAQRLSHTGSWGWNVANREIIHWSKEIYRLYGFDPQAGIPPLREFLQRIHPDDRGSLDEASDRAIRDGAEYELEFQVALPDGTTKYVHQIGHPVYNAAGELVEFIGTDMDITERKRAEAEAREGERRYREIQIEVAHANRVATIGQLTASIAHEVKQPIAAVVANAEAALAFLDHQPPNLEEVREALDCIVEDGDRGGQVIDRIRALVKRAPPRKDRLEINGAIREVIELTRGEAVKSGVAVEMHLSDGLPLIQGDRVQLQQVMLNLIINAVQAMSGVSEGPRELLVSTGTGDSSSVLVAVQDSGPGLMPAAHERVFDPFYTTKPTGLGMGLSICRSIIEAHGGRLWASATAPRGTIFQFTIPVGAADAT